MTQFEEFSQIEIPEILDTPEWVDASWSFNACPSVVLRVANDCPYQLRVWVVSGQYVDPTDDKFQIDFTHCETGDFVDEDHRGANTPEELQTIIDIYRDRLRKLLQKG
jgi:hypothetical protein